MDPYGDTWAKRKLGAAYDPEKHCAYTGRSIYPHPSLPGSMFYWRDDGHLYRSRAMTPEEAAWVAANPAEFARVDLSFRGWLESLRK